MRDLIIAGNWKMNKAFSETEEFLLELTKQTDDKQLNDVKIIICPPSLYFEICSDFTQDREISIGAQNVSEHEFGAYTGEISAPMLSSMDLDNCIVGHSERRKYFAESDKIVNSKIKSLLEYDIDPIVCIGESLSQREKGITKDVIQQQLSGTFKDIDLNSNIIIAYEPIWAIGTGKTASSKQAQEIHKFIRNWIKKEYSNKVAEEVHILYGGSMKPHNIEELIKQPDIDGGLIGGASLVTEKFNKMIDVAISMRK